MKKRENLTVIILSIISTVLFHNKCLGINILLIEIIVFIYIFLINKKKLKTQMDFIGCSALVVTTIFSLVNYSIFTFCIFFLANFVFVGVLLYPESKSFLQSTVLAISSFFISIEKFIQNIFDKKSNTLKIGNLLWKTRIYTIPVLIVFLFIGIYSAANPIFSQYVVKIFNFLINNWISLVKDLDFSVVYTFFVCLLISVFVVIRKQNQRMIENFQNSKNELERKRQKTSVFFRSNSLSNEYKAGIFLFIVLNSILFVLNCIDIRYVWFGFQWSGQYLKQFVHDGTYMLILSILISIAIVLFYFRRNLNFYPKNRLLKNLAYLWIAQNAILVISVALRNFYYINYFSLAYRRIGVLVFLLLTFYGLITVFYKVKERKTAYYLFRKNSLALYITLVICSTVNWDNFIANYNFQNAGKSFLHLDFMLTLSDKTLPILDKPLGELQNIEKTQKQKFSFATNYMSAKEYYKYIQSRKEVFLKKWEKKSFLEWNLPEYLSYQKLKTTISDSKKE